MERLSKVYCQLATFTANRVFGLVMGIEAVSGYEACPPPPHLQDFDPRDRSRVLVILQNSCQTFQESMWWRDRKFEKYRDLWENLPPT